MADGARIAGALKQRFDRRSVGEPPRALTVRLCLSLLRLTPLSPRRRPCCFELPLRSVLLRVGCEVGRAVAACSPRRPHLGSQLW
ncbi:hypothetical protein CC85DRAFT_12278 [Cutaneotrichosporon oleaginosum]|uniref:Uncharacterized protein n=1 Tax=Cutaneotrichosporon oleaginosum TaxID=879819 RepID=A0A0J1AUF5_9TREE|nr:uncharacterized protein CC85DRAFT_12278 [Cutaneotrichosporon oleaginosum]KLT38904.1 hypothetical protein CC85DRAFT_12278 [Cutaneotrichosporon oleaginosum]TXT10385.1 hypothetical protein COLE_04319 [Cutaneotrichosporon oleaginosum]